MILWVILKKEKKIESLVLDLEIFPIGIAKSKTKPLIPGETTNDPSNNMRSKSSFQDKNKKKIMSLEQVLNRGNIESEDNLW